MIQILAADMAYGQSIIIDGFERKVAVLLVGEAEGNLDVPRTSLAKKAKEGDWLKVEIAGGKVLSAEIDVEETAKRKGRIMGQMEKLTKKH